MLGLKTVSCFEIVLTQFCLFLGLAPRSGRGYQPFGCSLMLFSYVSQQVSCFDFCQIHSEWKFASVYQICGNCHFGHRIYLHVILYLRSEFRVNWPIWHQDIAKNHFQYGVHPPSWIWKISVFIKYPSSEWKYASVYRFLSKSDNSRLRYGDKAIFKMAAVCHIEFS